MICIDVPVEVAVVDLIEGEWARVEVTPHRLVDVPIYRLPAGTSEGQEVCYCRPVRSAAPILFRSCPDWFSPVFSNERRALWSR